MISTARRFSALALTLALAGCATTHYVSRPVELPLPAKPTLPAISGSNLQCLSADTYRALVERFRAIASDDNQLRAIIERNNQAAHDDTKD